ncbi:MAG: ATP-binding protein [Bacteroides cellulosilyticus]|nr:ATP-binding protein [Bacteroides cellulosilyticus]
MKFYNRETEIAKLHEIRDLSYNDHSRLTVVTGRRRIGKTSLISKALDDEPFIYLFVGRKNEASLCAGYCKEIANKLGIFVPPMTAFQDVFAFLMQQGETKHFSLVIDEFQEFFNINPSVYSDIQNHWDQYRLKTHVNFIVSGSVYSLMVKIFQNYHEPLFSRADVIMKLAPFTLPVLKQIMADHAPMYTNDDLLALYTVTGGIPKYVELLVDAKALSVKKIIHAVCDPDSPFKDEGKNLLVDEFGKQYGTYFSILDAISSGMNTQTEIASALGEKSIGGQLKKLEETYDIIRKMRPILSKKGTQTVRYAIADMFLRFWFRYFEGNRTLVEMNQFEVLEQVIAADYTTYSGKALEEYFKQQFIESHQYRDMGSYWEAKKGKGQCEIDIVALKLEKNKAVAVEVKRQHKEFKPEAFAKKVQHLKNKVLPKYEIEQICLTLEDM